MSDWEQTYNRPPSLCVFATLAGQLTNHSVWINLAHKPLNYQMLSSILAKSGCVLFCSCLYFALSVLTLAQSTHSVALHAGILLSHDSPHPRMHSVVWGIHRFPGWLFLEPICVYVRMCVLPICISMSLTQSICYTSSGINLSNLFYAWCPKSLSDSVVCVSACCKQLHIILHYSYNALSKMSLHI